MAAKEESQKQSQIQRQERIVERIPERVQERIVERIVERTPERKQERMQERIPERIQERMPERVQERMVDRVPERVPERMVERIPERVQERMPERIQERKIDRIPDRMPDRMLERIPDRMQDRMPDRMQDRMPERIPERMPERIQDRIPERVQGPPISQIMNAQKNISQGISPEIVLGNLKNSNQPLQNQMIMNLLNQSSMKYSNPPINPMNRTTQSPSVMQMMPQQPSHPQQNHQLPCLTNIVQTLDKSKVLPASNPYPSYMQMNPSMLVPDRRPIPESYMMKGNNYNQVPYSNFPMTGGMSQQVQLPRLNHISNTLNLNPYSQQPHQQIPFMNTTQLNKILVNQPRMQQNPHLGMYQNTTHPLMRGQPPHQDFQMQNPMLYQLGKPPMKPNQPQYPYSK